MRLSLRTQHLVLTSLVAVSRVAEAGGIPQNVRTFYGGLKTCSNKLASGFWSSDSGPNSEPPPPAPLFLPQEFPY